MSKPVKEIIQKLKKGNSLPPLTPKKKWDPGLTRDIEALDAAPAVKAVLHLWNDDLDRAHRIAQELESSTGSLIHAVMHRREPDYSNSKYWYRQVGSHPIFIHLVQEFSGWEPFDFVDRCQDASEAGDQRLIEELEAVQAREIEILLQYCLEFN